SRSRGGMAIGGVTTVTRESADFGPLLQCNAHDSALSSCNVIGIRAQAAPCAKLAVQSGWRPGMRGLYIVAAAIGAIASFAAAAAEDTSANACRALTAREAALAFLQIPDAPTTIVSARLVPAGGDGSVIEKDLPEICRIEGQIAPNVGFLL